MPLGRWESWGEEEWDVFLQVGTLHVGGRVLVQRPSASHLEWHSLRGASHTFTMTVEPLAGGIAARLSEKVAGGMSADR
jgi:hypothetical protein